MISNNSHHYSNLDRRVVRFNAVALLDPLTPSEGKGIMVDEKG